ncbi:hypothetical protein C5S32_03175 [ANME-1 cluster archaeon GoMg1]|nr:hypothetical protein [ANME-1 cluster archaeon GoMg1]
MRKIQQRIYLSRKRVNSIEFEHEILSIPLKAGDEMSFEILIINHGEPTHVHFSLSEEVKDKVMILQDKVYVIDEEKIAAIVKLPKSYAGAVDGGLDAGSIFVSTGYGAAKKGFSVEIVEEDEGYGKGTGEIVGGWIGESVVKKETVETGIVISPEKKALLRRLVISTVLMALFLVFVFAVYKFSFSGYPNFVFALLASMIFIFIVIYNL